MSMCLTGRGWELVFPSLVWNDWPPTLFIIFWINRSADCEPGFFCCLFFYLPASSTNLSNALVAERQQIPATSKFSEKAIYCMLVQFELICDSYSLFFCDLLVSFATGSNLCWLNCILSIENHTFMYLQSSLEEDLGDTQSLVPFPSVNRKNRFM